MDSLQVKQLWNPSRNNKVQKKKTNKRLQQLAKGEFRRNPKPHETTQDEYDDDILFEQDTPDVKNRFKFKSFSARIQDISLPLKSMKKTTTSTGYDASTTTTLQDQDDELGYFLTALQELDLAYFTKEYTDFRSRLTPFVSSLVSVLFHKSEIMDILANALTTTAIKPVSALLIALARDLQEEFYTAFPKVLEAVVQVASSSNHPEVLEASFQTMAYLFKYLSRLIVPDIVKTYHIISPLISHTKSHIRFFVAQAFGFLLRKVKKATLFEQMLTSLFHKLWEEGCTNATVEGTAVLLAECFKEVHSNFHSRASEMLAAALDLGLVNSAHTTSAMKSTLTYFFTMLGHHGSKDTLVPLWTVMNERLALLENERLADLVDLAYIWVGLRKGSRIKDHRAMIQILGNVIQSPRFTTDIPLTKASLRAFAILMLHTSDDLIIMHAKPILDRIFLSAPKQLLPLFFSFLGGVDYKGFSRFVYPYATRFAEERWNEDIKSMLLLFVKWTQIKKVSVEGLVPVRVPTGHGSARVSLVTAAKELSFLHPVPQNYLNVYFGFLMRLDQKDESLFDDLLVCLTTLFEKLPDQSSEMDLPGTIRKARHVSLCLAGSLLYFASSSLPKEFTRSIEQLWHLVTEKCIPSGPSHLILLKGVSQLTTALLSNSQMTQVLSVDSMKNVFTQLKENISSPVSQIRRFTLRILRCFKQLPLRHSEDSVWKGECPIFDICSSIEETPEDVINIRQKGIFLRKLESLVAARVIPTEMEKVIPEYCVALLSTNFAPVWPLATGTLVAVAKSDSALFWGVVKPAMERFDREDGINEANDISNVDTSESSIPSVPTKKGDIYLRGLICTHLRELNASWEKCTHDFENPEGTLQRLFVSDHSLEKNRIDPVNIFRLLVKVLQEIPSIAERRYETIIPFFTNHFNAEFTTTYDGDEQEETTSSARSRTKLVELMKLFAKFKNPTKIPSHQEVYDIYLSILSKGDSKMQELALNCILTWPQKGLKEYSEKLKELVQDDKFRDQLSTFDMEEVNSSVAVEDRPGLMDVVCRLLYGKVISKRGRSSSKAGMKARRVAIFAFVASLEQMYQAFMVRLMLEPFEHIVQFNANAESELKPDLDLCIEKSSQSPQKMGDLRRQIGFLSVLEDVMRQMRTHLVPFLPTLMTVLICQMNATELRLSKDTDEMLEGYMETQLREIRSLLSKRLVQIFSLQLDFEFLAYVKPLFEIYIDPRVERLSTENTQSVSGLLELLSSWTMDVRYVSYLTAFNPELVPSLISLLSATKVSKEVVSHVFGMVESLLQRHVENPELDIIPSTLATHFTLLLSNMEHVLSQSLEEGQSITASAKESIPIRAISILADLSEFVTEGPNASRIVNMMIPFLRKSHRAVPESTKCRMLKIMKNFFALLPILKQVHPAHTSYFTALCQLFSTLNERESRQELCLAFEKLASFAPSSPSPDALDVVAEMLTDLNAYSTKRLDEPDYDRRFDSFTKINQEMYATLSEAQWRPLLYCMVYFLHDKDEFSVRTSAAYSIQRFISQVEQHQQDKAQEVESIDSSAVVKPLSFMDLLLHMIIPSIRKGLKSDAESVRTEFLGLLGIIVQTFPEHKEFEDMTVLLSADEESNVFMNLYHMQMHRRIRALKRLGEALQEKKLKGSNVHHFFIPVVGHFISDTAAGSKPSSKSQKFSKSAPSSGDHNLANEAIFVLGLCAGSLSWTHYFALAKKYLFLVEKKHGSEKILVRTLVSIFQNFDYPIVEPSVVTVPNEEKKVEAISKNDNPMDVDSKKVEQPTQEPPESAADVEHEEEENEDEAEQAMSVEVDTTQLAMRVFRNLTDRILPNLYRLIAIKDDETVPVRIPLSISVTSLLQKLPESSKVKQLPRLLTTMCRILSSHLQGARDSVRDALSTIACMLGPAYLTFIVKEMQSALTRGYQLHVLGYTLHAVMASIATVQSDQSIASAVQPIVTVCIEDIFGETGKEKEVQELRSKMREIKVKKSFDTMDLLCQMVDYSSVPQILIPIKELMLNTNQISVVRDMEEYLRRMATGLVANSKVSTLGMMKFIHDLLHETLPFLQAPKQNNQSASDKEKNIKVQLKRTDPLQKSLSYYQANAHLFVEFGLSLLLVSLKKERIKLKSKEDLEMLDPFITSLGKALYSPHEDVILGAVRVLTILFPCALPSLKKSQGAILKRLFQLVGKSASNDTLLAQALLRLLALILRDCNDVEIKEKQIILVLKLIQPDLEEVERQTITFSLIRAVLSRKIMAKEVYDLMDRIAHILITSQSANVREVCRQTYIQFLLDYPHGHKRIHDQMVMLIKNLEYQHESGRSSVMELLHQAMSKFSDEVVLEFCDVMFVALVQALVNDTSATCRKMAGFLISSLLKRIELTRSEKLIKMCFLWIRKGIDSDSGLTLARAGVQVFGFVVETFGSRVSKWIPDFLEQAVSIFDGALAQVKELEASFTTEESIQYWEICYATLNTLQKIWTASQASFAHMTPVLSSLYDQLKALLIYPHSWVRLLTSKLISNLFIAIDVSTCSWAASSMIADSEEELDRHPLLENRETINQLVSCFCEQLTSDVITDEGATLVVKNLFFVGKCLMHFEMDDESMESKDHSDDDEIGETAEEEVDVSKSTTRRHPVVLLTRKLANLARLDSSKRKNPILRKSVMQWFAAMSGIISDDLVQPCLYYMVSFLYRTINDTTSTGQDAEELKQLAQQVQDLLKTRFTTPVFVQVYNEVHKHVLNKRQKRRADAAVRAVADPEAHAKRKLQRNEMKKKNRKRKVEEFNKNRIRYNDPKKMKRHA